MFRSAERRPKRSVMPSAAVRWRILPFSAGRSLETKDRNLSGTDAPNHGPILAACETTFDFNGIESKMEHRDGGEIKHADGSAPFGGEHSLLIENNAPRECTDGSFVIDADGRVRKATPEQQHQAIKARKAREARETKGAGEEEP